MKKILIYLFAMALLVAGNAPLASAATDNLRMASGVVGSLNYGLANGITAVYQKHSGQTLEVLTKDITATVPELYAGRYEIAVCMSGAPYIFYHSLDLQTMERTDNKKRPPIRLIMMGNKALHGILNYADSGLTKASELKGKRVTLIFGQLSAQLMSRACLVAAGLTEKDITVVRSSTIPKGAELLQTGAADTCYGAPTTPAFRELDAGKKVRYLTFESTPEIRKNLSDFFPGATLVEVEPTSAMVGISERTTLLGAHNCLSSATNIPDDVIYNFVKTLYENRAELVPYGADFVGWQTEPPVSTLPLAPYHPGAIRYWKEIGLWTPEMEKQNQELLDLYDEE